MRILEEFWYGNVEPMEYGSFFNEEYKELLRLITKNEEMYWSSFLVTLCSEIMLYIETPLVSYSYSLNEVSHSCTS